MSAHKTVLHGSSCRVSEGSWRIYFLHTSLLMSLGNQAACAEHLCSCRGWKCFTSWRLDQSWDMLAEFPLTSMGPRLILHETLSNTATCGEGLGEPSSCLAVHRNAEMRVQTQKWRIPYPIATAGGMEVSRRLLPQLGFGISFQASSTLGPSSAKGQKHRGLMDAAWDWEADILECTSVDVLGSDLLTVC